MAKYLAANGGKAPVVYAQDKGQKRKGDGQGGQPKVAKVTPPPNPTPNPNLNLPPNPAFELYWAKKGDELCKQREGVKQKIIKKDTKKWFEKPGEADKVRGKYEEKVKAASSAK